MLCDKKHSALICCMHHLSEVMFLHNNSVPSVCCVEESAVAAYGTLINIKQVKISSLKWITTKILRNARKWYRVPPTTDALRQLAQYTLGKIGDAKDAERNQLFLQCLLQGGLSRDTMVQNTIAKMDVLIDAVALMWQEVARAREHFIYRKSPPYSALIPICALTTTALCHHAMLERGRRILLADVTDAPKPALTQTRKFRFPFRFWRKNDATAHDYIQIYNAAFLTIPPISVDGMSAKHAMVQSILQNKGIQKILRQMSEEVYRGLRVERNTWHELFMTGKERRAWKRGRAARAKKAHQDLTSVLHFTYHNVFRLLQKEGGDVYLRCATSIKDGVRRRAPEAVARLKQTISAPAEMDRWCSASTSSLTAVMDLEDLVNDVKNAMKSSAPSATTMSRATTTTRGTLLDLSKRRGRIFDSAFCLLFVNYHSHAVLFEHVLELDAEPEEHESEGAAADDNDKAPLQLPLGGKIAADGKIEKR